MKRKLFILTIPLILSAQSTQPDLKWVDNEIEAIKPPRKGVSLYKVSSIKDPFARQIALNQPPVEEHAEMKKALPEPEAFRPFTLQAILNHTNARIDGKWYKVDDKIYGYTIQDISYDTVLLSKKKKKLKLTLFKKNKNIQINAK